MNNRKAEARARIKAELEAQALRERRQERLLRFGIAAIVLVAVAVIGIVLVNRSDGPEGTGAIPTGSGVTADGDGVSVGEDAAPAVIEYWFDFQCPYCGQFEAENGPVLDELVADGTARVVYHPVAFIGDESHRASNAFGCAIDAGRPVEYLTELFANQPAERTGGYTEDDLVAHGASAGLTGEPFESCVRDGTYADWGQHVREAFRDAGFSVTPTVLLNGEEVENPAALTADAFRALVDQAVTAS